MDFEIKGDELKISSSVLVAGSLVGLGSIAFSRSLLRDRAELEQLHSLPAVEEMDPADFLGTTVLGGLRPLAIDLLWMRAADAFSRKDWYDALAVSEMICRLQPNLPKVWEMNSWNMAYNISAARKQAGKMDEAWEWVKKGIDFQKKGIEKNSDDPQMYRWLAHMFFDKGTSEDYGDRFEAAGIDAHDAAISAARAGAKVDSHGFFSHYLLSIFIRKKLEAYEQEENLSDAEKADLVALAQEGIAALNISLQRAPEEKDFTEFRQGIGERISKLEKFLESAKVSPGAESKQSSEH